MSRTGSDSERLETSLPDPAHMLFQVDPYVADVTITNRGLLFPDCASPPPNLASMFFSISTGLAGNPVFTDTRRPPRGN